MSQRKTRATLGFLGLIVIAMAGCKNSTGFWRSLDGGAAPTADYRPSTTTPDTGATPSASPATQPSTSQTASQTTEPGSPSEPR
jgi:hypothetical protein